MNSTLKISTVASSTRHLRVNFNLIILNDIYYIGNLSDHNLIYSVLQMYA